MDTNRGKIIEWEHVNFVCYDFGIVASIFLQIQMHSQRPVARGTSGQRTYPLQIHSEVPRMRSSFNAT